MKDTHPIELGLVAAIAACTAITWALRAVLVPLVALVLTLAGWRPAAAATPAAAAPAAGPVALAAPAPEPIPATSVATLRKQARQAGHPAAWCRTARKAQLLQALADGSGRINRATNPTPSKRLPRLEPAAAGR